MMFFPTAKPNSLKNKTAKKNNFLGVRQRQSGKWVVEIKDTTQKIRMWLGTFDTTEEAARAYDEAAFLLRGSNTRKNFVDSSSPNSSISMKVKSLLNQKRASRQNLTFPTTNPTTKLTKKTSSRTTNSVPSISLNQDFNILHQGSSSFNFSFYPPNPGAETITKTSSQTSSPQSCSKYTRPDTSGYLDQDFRIVDDDAYRLDLSQCLYGEGNLTTFQYDQAFGNDFYKYFSKRGEFFGQVSDILAPKMSESQLPEFDYMKVERQISAMLYAMNGVNDYWQNFYNPCDSL